MDTGKTLIALRVPSLASSRRLAKIADQRDEAESHFIRTAIVQLVKPLNDEWVSKLNATKTPARGRTEPQRRPPS
jgi:hypothetical protein